MLTRSWREDQTSGFLTNHTSTQDKPQNIRTNVTPPPPTHNPPSLHFSHYCKFPFKTHLKWTFRLVGKKISSVSLGVCRHLKSIPRCIFSLLYSVGTSFSHTDFSILPRWPRGLMSVLDQIQSVWSRSTSVQSYMVTPWGEGGGNVCVWQVGLWSTSMSYVSSCDNTFPFLSLSLFFVSVFLSLSVILCLIRVMTVWGGKFPLWVRKYNTSNNIPSDKSHPVVCACMSVSAAHVSACIYI